MCFCQDRERKASPSCHLNNRPVKACAAKREMFTDCPRQHGRQMHFRWLDPFYLDFEVATKLKRLVKKHSTETAFMLKQQLDKEEKLVKQQKRESESKLQEL
ncbi:hypothetical protein PTKIN_Ptkin12aG0093000 [Pterospermum kingtungense]